VDRAIKFIENIVLPQLRNLASDRNSSLDGEILPPRRVVEHYKETEWIPQKAPTKKYQFVHNDLRQNNILCNQQTRDIISIIDWEHTGYYEQHFEKDALAKASTRVTYQTSVERRRYTL
jgi:thiamine kinase-like enzyme